MNLQEHIRKVLREELNESTTGLDEFLNSVTNRYPETIDYIDKIKSFIEESGCKKIEIARFKHAALGLALHNGVLLNQNIFFQSLPNFLFILFHEIAHQYQYKKYGDEKMYEFYLGEIGVREAAILMKKLEMIADEFATRKVREFVRMGLISQPNTPGLAQYNNVSLSYFENFISQIKNEILRKGYNNFDQVAELFYNMIKMNENNSNIIKETITDKKVICDNCGWSWDISDGGDDLYICHKCGNDNEPTVGMMFESKSNKYDKFITYCKRFLDLKDIPEIIYNNTSKFEKEHKSFGLYDQLKDQIIVSTHKRNVGDIMRTIAHELVHYQQKTLHRKGKSSAGSKHENEANAVAGEIVRKYRQKHPEIFS